MAQELWHSRGIKRFGLLVATMVFSWHIAAITLPQMPRNSGFGSAPHDFFGPYLRRTGTWGAWEMFTTIPYYHYLTVELLVKEMGNTEQTLGVMLPEFSEMSQHIRVMLYFLRVVWPDSLTQVYRDTYIQKVCNTYQEKFGRPAFSVTLIAKSLRLRRATDTAKDGVMGERQTYEKGPFRCKEPQGGTP